jgi:hypothetical protein
MPSRLDDLLSHISQLEREVEGELEAKRHQWRYQLDVHRVRFDRDVQLAHARIPQSIPAFLRESHPLSVLSAPVIYSLIVPIALLDVWITVYQRLCFPLYGIARVRRSAYIVIDRHHLAYLNAIEKFNCFYCSYGNGVFAYAREVAGRTEQYWCPIRHARRVMAPHRHYGEFVDYGDAEGYRKQLPVIRDKLK